MGLKDIPIVGIGPGSLPGEDDGAALDYLDMPREMNVYYKPALPEPEAVGAMGGAIQAMDWLQQALERYQPGADPMAMDISGLDAGDRELVNQVLGEGEVGVRYEGTFKARMQESVLAGVWRTFYLAEDEKPVRDFLEVGDLPILARLTDGRDEGALAGLTGVQTAPDVINARPILSELAEHLRTYVPGKAAHVVNLTLLPLSQADLDFLDEVLGHGPVAILSRGYGDCEITSTRIADLWWVRYYNATGKLILNTLEVVDVPIVARAAPEDLDDSRRRLKELLEPYADMWTAG